MSAIVAAALVMLLAGSTILRSVLDAREHPGWVILYWLSCAWLTVCALLLAALDLLLVRAEGRAARKLLRERIRQQASKL
jgi:hypothetical protein